MNRRRALQALAGLALCPICARTALAAGAHWGYQGADGPAHWGKIDAASKVCAIGTQQSPIDIEHPIKAQLPPIKIAWHDRCKTIVNNSHTIQLDVVPGSTISIGNNDTFTLVQFHFHHPGEHTFAGKAFAMEAHFVHQNDDGALAVLGVMMNPGSSNAVFKKIVETMPKEAGPPVKADPKIDPHALLPSERGYYRYEGSLTIPPCSEMVSWLLLREPIQVAKVDIDAFAKVFPMNARPLQKLERRFILMS